MRIQDNNNTSLELVLTTCKDPNESLNNGRYVAMLDIPNFLIFQILMDKLESELGTINRLTLHKQLEGRESSYTAIAYFLDEKDGKSFCKRLNGKLLSAIKKVRYNISFVTSIMALEGNAHEHSTLNKFYTDYSEAVVSKRDGTEVNR